MQVDQRATALTGTNTGYTVDRWRVGNYTGYLQVTTSQNSDVPSGQGFTHSLRMTTTNVATYAGDTIQLTQAIEGLNSAQLAWGTAGAKTITVSFWVRSAVTGTYSIVLNNWGGTRNYVASYTISAANTWEKKTLTIPGETSGTWLTTNGMGINLAIVARCESPSAGAAGAWTSTGYYGVTGQANAFATVGNIFAITGVQLEANTQATPFEHRPIGTELALCQRYFYKTLDNGATNEAVVTSWGSASTTTQAQIFLVPPVTMRSQPTVIGSSLNVVDGQSVYAVTSVTTRTDVSSKNLSLLAFNVASGLTQFRPYYARAQDVTSGFISLSAEI
jgi:hypothetical protein